MRYQKHESDAIKAIEDVAKQYGITSQQGRQKKKHAACVALLRPHDNYTVTISIASSPRDKSWAVMLAEKTAIKICRELLAGERPAPWQHT